MAKILFMDNFFEKLGVEYLSSVLKKAGHGTKLIVDPQLFNDGYISTKFLSGLFNDKKDSILKEVCNYEPDLIGFSVLTDSYQWALNTAGFIKRKFPAIPIIFGGIHPTLVPDRVIKKECVDMVCVGEAEDAILGLADCIDKGRLDYNIQNIWFKTPKGIVKNAPRRLSRNLDSLPFPDKDLYEVKYKIFQPEYFIMASRGCPYSCSYCCNHSLNKIYGGEYLRRRSVHNVILELITAKRKHGFNFVWFLDDAFASSEEWLEEFSIEYKQKIDSPFFCYIHPKDVTPEKISLLRHMGCHEVGVGIQTINDGTKKIILRGESLEDIESAIRILKNSGILFAVENIIGLPHEEEKDLLKLIEFYNDLRPDIILYSYLKVFPETQILRHLIREGMVTHEKLGDILDGRGNSLARGGNFIEPHKYRDLASLLVMVPFLKKSNVSRMIKNKSYRYLPLKSGVFQFLTRWLHTKRFINPNAPRVSYDAGLKRYIRSYKYYLTRNIKEKIGLGKIGND